MENHVKRDPIPGGNLRHFSRGKDGPGGVPYNDKPVFERRSICKFQLLALRTVRGADQSDRKQTGKPLAKETSTTLSSHQFLLLVYDADETERVRLRRYLSNVPVEAQVPDPVTAAAPPHSGMPFRVQPVAPEIDWVLTGMITFGGLTKASLHIVKRRHR
jgi:hypothetical protein